MYSELTSKGDDFTKQMFQMYNTLEDIVHSSKMNDNTTDSRSLDQLYADNHSVTGAEMMSKSNTLTNSNCNNGCVNSSVDSLIFNANPTHQKSSNNICESNQSHCVNNSGDNHIVNPLLDTINSLTSCSDSSDECDINKKCYQRNERHRRILNGGSRPLNRKSCNYYYSSSDAESISGYTGTNSLESGYKSDYLGSNTPEIIDGSSLSSFGTAIDCAEPLKTTTTAAIHPIPDAVNEAITHQMSGIESTNNTKKNAFKETSNNNSNSKTSLDKNYSNNNTNVNNKYIKCLIDNQSQQQKHQKQSSDDASSTCSAESYQTSNHSSSANHATNTQRKTSGGMFGEKIANRLKAFSNDTQLDHLLKLRKSLLKALKRCEKISSPVNSRDGSPITVAGGVSVSSRSSSPASTVIKSYANNNSSANCRRLRDETDKCGQRLASSPLTIRSTTTGEPDLSDRQSTMESMANSCPNGSTHNKSVRFNSSVKFSTNCTQLNRKQQISGNYVSNKSILKDPLCETLRTAIKAGEFANNCSLEGEIDELLYGRTGAYYYAPQQQPQQSSTTTTTTSSKRMDSTGSGHHLADELMCPSSAYVAMIEEKYRTLTAANGSSGYGYSGGGVVVGGKLCTTTSSAANSKKTINTSKVNIEIHKNIKVSVKCNFGVESNYQNNRHKDYKP
ncbi:unnamed protein product [Medioppia subpectinata]|uniref:Uncharacterized protein n=1 Tax=Medioppia subpectinata TaxID=1979941 RepID=A0A7R9KBJ8_9ACAR|nr:unnamed protein product [Medioppia subpectinata]CAG2100080.1 unnamed protein product [Medioppia subpectinata]